MSISRDEAREIAIIGLLVTATVRIGAGVIQAIEELGGAWTVRSVLARFFAPVGSTVGMLTLGAVLIVVFSPTGSITRSMVDLCRRFAGGVAILGTAASFNTLALSYATFLGSLWFAMINGLATAILGGTAYWILRNFDPDR